ncbi:hypothetical protein ARAM_001500 [Aspergillus rambellii]|uniref:Alpha/beta hydrolase fold-3 domain-containing protein n=1 Tax=Aspergillus rambellii TaxID=308745 RepID=A0A0F8UHF8_9EURO|nr:hypothetical protein ARAM_001500 [Aspergillus rambellii]
MGSASQNASSADLSVWEKLDLVCKIVLILVTIPFRLVAGLFRGSRGAKSYRVHVGHGLVRTLTGRLTARQTQYMGPPTNKGYEAWAKENRFPPDTVELKHGGLGHWLGNKKAKKVLIYYHGGGFQLSANPFYFKFLSDLIQDLGKQGKDLSVFLLTYTLTPHATYPTQLRQSVEALRYILSTSQYSPSDIYLGGDSAGGNICLGVLSHLSHPHPEIEAVQLNRQLGGMFMLSPWVSFSADWPSVREHEYKDVVDKKSGLKWADDFLGGRKGDNYCEAVLAPPEWWANAKVRDVLVIAGSEELLLSSIEVFVKKFKGQVPNTQYVLVPDEGHVSVILDSMIGVEQTRQEKALKSWLSDVI